MCYSYWAPWQDAAHLRLEDLHRVAQERLDDDHLKILVVGDREAVEPGLRELDLPVVMVDYEGNALT
jgi:hypothetical protein